MKTTNGKGAGYKVTALVTWLLLVPGAAFAETAKPEILTTPPNIPPGVIPDEINTTTATNLDGYVVEYTYSSGRAYRLRFYDDRVSFTQLNAADIPTLTLPYLSREIDDEIYLVHWMVPGRIGHVSLILDLGTRKIHASALMPGKMELFDEGKLTSIELNGEKL